MRYEQYRSGATSRKMYKQYRSGVPSRNMYEKYRSGVTVTEDVRKPVQHMLELWPQRLRYAVVQVQHGPDGPLFQQLLKSAVQHLAISLQSLIHFSHRSPPSGGASNSCLPTLCMCACVRLHARLCLFLGRGSLWIALALLCCSVIRAVARGRVEEVCQSIRGPSHLHQTGRR